jgi:hypothetical protein
MKEIQDEITKEIKIFPSKINRTKHQKPTIFKVLF